MRVFFNLVKASLHLALASVLGYYNFVYNHESPYNGQIALITNVCFLIIGISLVATWRKPERRVSEHVSEAMSLLGTTSPVAAATNGDTTGRQSPSRA